MKKFITTIAILISAAGYGQFNQVESESEIKAVTVFTTAAQINREASVSLQKGYNRVKIKELSPFINANSIQVTGFKDVTIISVNHSINYLSDKEMDPEFDRLLKQRDDLVYKREKIRIELRNLGREKQLIYSNKEVRSKKMGLHVEDLMDMSDFYRDRIKNINEAQMDLNEEDRDFTKKINKLNKQLIERRSLNNKSRANIEVTVKAEKSVKGTLKFNYVVRNAGWYPLYDLRSDELGADINFTYKAKVYQQTGNDWENVELALSTGNPQESSTPPTVYPWKLSYTYAQQQSYGYNQQYNQPAQQQYIQQQNVQFEQMPQQRKYNKQDKAIADTTFIIDSPVSITGNYKNYEKSAKDGGSSRYYPNGDVKEELNFSSTRMPGVSGSSGYMTDTRNTTADNTSMSETSVNTVFEIDIPYSIPTDGKKYTVEVQSFDIPAHYEYYCAPRSDNDAFLIAKITGWDELNILPGNSSIYFQNTFVGEAFINPNITQDTLELSLGRDKNINVERKMIKDYSKKVTIGSKRKVTRGYQIKVRNTRNKEVRLILVDQIPISKHKDVEVELQEKDGAKLTEDEGKLEWDITIPPGETKTVTFKFEVKYPKDHSVSNL